MKKKIIIIVVSLMLVIAVCALIIPKNVYSKWFGKDKNIEEVEKYNCLVYVQNEKNQIVGVNVEVDHLEDDEIKQKWDILTSQSNLIPTGYTSLVSSDVVLNDYIVEENVLKLNVSKEIENANKLTLTTLVWTFVNDDIEELELYVDNNKVSEVSDYKISKLNKQMGINYTFETSYLFESNATTIVYQEDDYILPVTYFHLNSDICDYIVMKVLDESTKDFYDYTLEDSILTIDFVDASILTANQIASISESVALNFEVSGLNINNNENIFYQRVFDEIIENE